MTKKNLFSLVKLKQWLIFFAISAYVEAKLVAENLAKSIKCEKAVKRIQENLL